MRDLFGPAYHDRRQVRVGRGADRGYPLPRMQTKLLDKPSMVYGLCWPHRRSYPQRENEGEGHMTNKTTDAPFNVLDYLITSAMIDAYVAEAYASGDSEYIAEALETAAIARDRIKTAPQPTSDRG
jgi:hypothetical protein